MIPAKKKANELRDRFGCTRKARFPVHEVAKWYNVDVVQEAGPGSRVRAAQQLGKHFEVDNPEDFAADLLAPLWLVEPVCCYGGIKTGESYFFGLFERKRGYTLLELTQMFDVPEWMMQSQIESML